MPAPTAVVGQLLEGRYRLGEVVGVGGMATVYRARDDVLAREVAVKLFPPTGSADDQERQRAEISVLAKLNHPGLVSLLDAGSDSAAAPRSNLSDDAAARLQQEVAAVVAAVPDPATAGAGPAEQEQDGSAGGDEGQGNGRDGPGKGHGGGRGNGDNGRGND